MSLYVFLVEKGVIKLVCTQLATTGVWRGHPKCVQFCTRRGGGGVKHHVYLRTYTISFHVPLFIFVLECLVLFEEM